MAMRNEDEWAACTTTTGFQRLVLESRPFAGARIQPTSRTSQTTLVAATTIPTTTIFIATTTMVLDATNDTFTSL